MIFHGFLSLNLRLTGDSIFVFEETAVDLTLSSATCSLLLAKYQSINELVFLLTVQKQCNISLALTNKLMPNS